MPAQLGGQEWKCNEGNNTDEVVDATMECEYNCVRLLLYAKEQHINVLLIHILYV